MPHAAVEKWLRASSMSWTFIRPSFFQQNLSTIHAADIHAADIRDRDDIVVPAGNGRTAFVDTADVGVVAAVALLHPTEHVD